MSLLSPSRRYTSESINLASMDKVTRTEEQWREQLSPQEYRVLRQAGTEAPFTGEYTDTKTTGVYRCRACGAELFRSDAKFESHCGWPSFYEPSDGDAVTLIEDRSHGMLRVEARCARCDSHLGHVFTGEGYDTTRFVLGFRRHHGGNPEQTDEAPGLRGPRGCPRGRPTDMGVSNPYISGFGHYQPRWYQGYGEDFRYGEGFSPYDEHKFTGS